MRGRPQRMNDLVDPRPTVPSITTSSVLSPWVPCLILPIPPSPIGLPKLNEWTLNQEYGSWCKSEGNPFYLCLCVYDVENV